MSKIKYLEGTKIIDLRGIKFSNFIVKEFDSHRYNIDKERKEKGEIVEVRPNWICECIHCNGAVSVSRSKIFQKNSHVRCTKCNSFGMWLIKNLGNTAIEKYWSNKNTFNPFNIAVSSPEKVWIVCQNDKRHGSYYTSCGNFALRENRCPICVNKKIVKGINDMSTTHPYLTKYFANIEEAYIYSYSSNKKIEFKCPDCGNIKKATIHSLYSQGFSCPACGDGISLPNKIMFNILNQLNISFYSEKKFTWSNNRFYDFFIPSLNCIIEMNGKQHYTGSFGFKGGKRTLEEEQENDRLKEQLALENEIDYYIVIDCRRSELEYIKNNILNSRLAELFDLSNIDWNDVGMQIFNNKIKDVCDLWIKHKSSNNFFTTSELAEMVGLNRYTVLRYLKQGAELGWCDYDTRQEILNHALNMTKKLSKKVEVFKGDISYGVFDSYNDLERKSFENLGVKISRTTIKRKIKNNEEYKGFIFKLLN